jgi:hypothetical protein
MMRNGRVTVAFLEGLIDTTKIIGELVDVYAQPRFQLSTFRMKMGSVTVCGNLIDTLRENLKRHFNTFMMPEKTF